MRAKGEAVHKGAPVVLKLMKKHGVKVILDSDMFGDEVKFALGNIISASEVPGTGYTSLDIMKLVMKDGHIYKNIVSAPGDPKYIPVTQKFRVD